MTNDLRRENRQEIDRIISAVTSQRTMADWIEYLNQAGVPCGPIYTVDQTFADPQVQHQQMLLEVEQPSGKVKTLGSPLKLSTTPANLRRPAPQLGQHNEEILTQLGYSLTEIDAFRTQGTI